jgi:sugar O-acyltransferase (sialic acid O-acetyltransferase NeuD family)
VRNADTVLIYGASGHGKVIIDIIEKEGKYKIAGLLDDNSAMHGKDFCRYSVIGGFDNLTKKISAGHKLILAVGDNKSRKKLCERVKPLGYELICAIHPSVQVGKDVLIDSGTAVMANVAINSGTRIGENVILNTGATVDHDCIIGDYVHISPGAHLGGNVEIGDLTHIGIGVSIIPNIKIGEEVVIGAGTVVVEDIPNNVTAVGVPAKVIKKH